ncbi:MAG: TetR/AcrR family transcriptional regulator [Acutalibacteraceae bacterium]
MAKAEYRSSIRSKNLIKKALAKLIHTKDVSKITVSDIIREADISRGTFYAHYADVNSVVEQIESEELQKIIDFVNDFGVEQVTDNVGTFIKMICEYLSNDMEYYRMLTQSNMLDSFIWRLVNIYYDRLLEALISTEKHRDIDEANLYLLYITSASKTVLVNWLSGEIKGTPDQIAERLGKLINLNQKYYDD